MFAAPVTFVTSSVYACLVVPTARRWHVAKIVLLVFSGYVGACVVAEAIALSIWGAKGTYAHFRHLFTLVHFVNYVFVPPAVAHVAFYIASRLSSQAWLQSVGVVGCCWLACMSVIIGHIVIDEAIVGPNAGKPFYLTGPTRPNHAASGNGDVASWFQFAGVRVAVPEQKRWNALLT